ncbi:MAG TPA: chemotaxis protein CheX [Bryobacteraceae bacterium]|nr:chemotaxis protein CheX [Bryobacteraceae bacterium]
MTGSALSVSLREAVDEVLETMFFVQNEGQAVEDRPIEELVASRVDFEGSPSGMLSLRITLQAAQGMAADFLGQESSELPPGRTTEVVSELANMICGAVLSRVESETTFRLSPPRTTIETGDVLTGCGDAIVCRVQLPDGALSVSFVYHGAGS